MTLRDRIRASHDRTAEVVDVPEWDGVKLEFRSPTVNERAALLRLQAQGEDGEAEVDRAERWAAFYPEILIRTAFDPETGEPAFTEDDADWLRERDFLVMDRLAVVALKVCGMSSDAEEDLGKGSSTTPSTDSSSSS